MTTENKIRLAYFNALKYSDHATALRVASRVKAGTIVLGDDMRYWVVTIREASILMNAGYELA